MDTGDETSQRRAAQPAPARPAIAIVPSFLRGYGGMEQWTETLATVARDAGWTVVVAPPRRPEPGGELERGLDGLGSTVAVDPAEVAWAGTWAGRAWRAAAGARWMLRRRRWPDGAVRAGLAGDRARGFLDRYWSAGGPGARLVARVDVVHVLGAHPFGGAAIKAAARAGVPVVYNLTAAVRDEDATDPYLAPFRAAVPSIDVVLVNGLGQAADVARVFGYKGRVEVVDQWLDAATERTLLGVPAPTGAGREVVVGSLARLSEVKGLDVLVAGVGRAIRADAPLRLRLAGDGPEGPRLAALAGRLEIADRVELVGFVAPAERAAFYASIDVFVLASSVEGGPLSAVDAMAAGRVVVTTPVGAMPDRLVDGQDGRFFPVGDAEALAAILVDLSGDPAERARLGQAARAAFLGGHTAAGQTGRLAALWHGLAHS